MSISARGSFQRRSTPLQPFLFELSSFTQRRLNHSFALSPLFIFFYCIYYSCYY
ncbi:hypothetical protein BDV38DRAFT_243134, partial [Aspergillus pseudotamarii]